MNEFGPGPSPEDIGGIEGEKKEPTVRELFEAICEVISAEECEDILGMDMDEAIGYSISLLLENGIEDPESFLIEKGILE